MSDISDKAVQDALRAAEGGLLLTKGQVATLRARFEADARAIRAASVMRTSAALWLRGLALEGLGRPRRSPRSQRAGEVTKAAR